MKRGLTSVLIALVCTISLLSFISCSEDEPNTSRLVGKWETVYNSQSGDISRDDPSYMVYTFYEDGTGYVERWDIYNLWKDGSFDWKWYSTDNSLNIFYSDKSPFDTFFFRFKYNNLELSKSSSFSTYTRYQYIR